MDFELDKHDIFRNVVPGSIFLLVLLFFFFVNDVFSIETFKNVEPLNILLGIAITLPIGYLIHNIYRVLHIWKELNVWYEVEHELLQKVLKNTNAHVNLKDGEHGSWFIEVCLHENGSAPVRERLYTLISRVHSAGSAMVAIWLAIIASGLLLLFTKHQVITKINVFLFVVWVMVSLGLCVSRKQTIKSYQIFIDHFLNIRQKLVIDAATGKKDLFENER